MAELTPRFTWVLELTTPELVLISDALEGELTLQNKEAAARLGAVLLQKRLAAEPDAKKKR